MIINHNMSSIFAARQENLNGIDLKKSMEKLSSGQRINRGADDASNLAVSEKMRSQIRGLNQASKNVQNDISFIQTTEGYLQETTDILQRIRELAVQAANGIYSDEDRSMMQVEISQLVAEVDRIASSAQFNGYNMLTGRFSKENDNSITFQVGANVDQNIKVNIASATAESLGIRKEEDIVSVEDVETANRAIVTIDEALKYVNKQRADLGAVQNRMEMAAKGINIASENMTSSESIIRDTDVATETVNFVKNEILQSVSSSMLSQALYTNKDNVLKLLS